MAHYTLYKDFYIFVMLSWKWQMKIISENEKWRKTSSTKKRKNSTLNKPYLVKVSNILTLRILCWGRYIIVRNEIASSNFLAIHFISFGIYAKLVISQLCIINKMKCDLHYPFHQFSSLISPNLYKIYSSFDKITSPYMFKITTKF